ncbi:MAG: BamA/TamA family outer membrane protein [Bdellovibrionaceae bacterium]|nr:BamA/TamA family outer membrane protein [Pseudobdellovibrionaceae bacterium]
MRFFSVTALVIAFASESFAQNEDLKEDYSKKLILLPIVYYTPETKISAGALFVKNLWKEKEGHTSSLLGSLSLTENKQTLATLAPKLYFNRGDWDLSGSFFYSYYPNRYYGRGVNNSLKDPEPYTENNLLLSLGVGKNLYSHLFIRVGTTKDQRKIVDSQPSGLIAGEIQAVTEDLEVQSANIGFEWDERDFPQAPIEGAWYRITHSWFTPVDRQGGKTLAPFRKIDFDFRKYTPVTTRWAGALQLLASEVQGNYVPFQYLNFIGGGVRMRGFYNGQYRDFALGMIQTELRFDWRPNWLFSIFGGVARLGRHLDDIPSSESFYSGGGGVHYILDPENRTKLRLDMGFNGKERGVYFLVGDAF